MDHHHPQNPSPSDTHFSENFDYYLPEFEFSDFLLLDHDASEEGFSPENMASSDNVIDRSSIEPSGASSANSTTYVIIYIIRTRISTYSIWLYHVIFLEIYCDDMITFVSNVWLKKLFLFQCRRYRSEVKKGKTDAGGCRVAFRTKSELEIMDDGFKWRKYGKKMVKNNSNPR